MKVLHNIYAAILVLVVSVGLFFFSLFQYQLSSVSHESSEKEVIIEQGSVDAVARTLYQEGLIRDVLAFKLYSKLSGKTSLKAATYYLSPSMGSKNIIDILYRGNGKNSKQVSITFKEGYNINKFIQIVTSNTNILEEDIIAVLEDKEYLNELIHDYWFLTDDILNEKIYYSLEGYLYPNTYFFSSCDVSVKEIIISLLDETKKQLSPYQDKISTNNLRIHEIFTLASIVELEGTSLEDRKGIASVFMNRLEKGMTLGSDVTTYYGAHVNIGDRDLYASEVRECNDYNTRCATFTGLPVSPIDNPSIESIEAVLDQIQSDYYYFVADKNKKIYFSKNITEHNNIISQLKKQGLWYEY